MKTPCWPAVLAAGALLWGLAAARPGLQAEAARRSRVVVLPFAPEPGSDPREGMGLAVGLFPRLGPEWEVVSLEWAELAALMDKEGLDKKAFHRPEVLQRIGRALGADAVFSGSFRASAMHYAARPVLVDVRTGRLRRGAERLEQRHIMMSAPEPRMDLAGLDAIEPLVPDKEDRLSLRDALASPETCEGAAERVDAIEAGILELKARYWALQLSRKVSYGTLKFNPGSTITDPELKRRFYGRMGEWTRQRVIPELSPHEAQQFAEEDAKAIKIARKCGIL
ncbi:MAG: hypothetical protein HY927_07565 [Elusimicrobia bacterium]|nr:hypothetical protein [Elusimicrobiota bacterium]